MSQYQYPVINVSGKGNLKIYAIDYSVATVDSPGRASVTYIDKQNSLTTPALSVKNPTFLTIGRLNFKGYPVKYKKSLSSSGESLLTVEYIDGSFILDQYNIGLLGKHVNGKAPFNELFGSSKIKDNGLTFASLKSFAAFSGSSADANTKDIPSWLILVGKSVDPCKAKFEELATDPCNPCPEAQNSIAEQALAIDCNKLRSQEVMAVDYSFSELLEALKAKNLKIVIREKYNSNYRASFYGSLRDVLKTWCSIFGFSFYFSNGKIYIFDASSGVNINASFSDSIILNKTEESSIEHTKATSSILYYSQPGIDKNYNCSDKHGKKVLCRPLTIKDLGVKGLRADYGCNSDSNLYDLIEFMSTFSAYNQVLREMMAWFEVYRIRDAAAAKALVVSSSSSGAFGGTKYGGYYQKGVDDDIKNIYSLPLLSMTIKAVFDKDSPEFKTLMGGSNLDDSIKKKAAGNYEPYFFIASQNEARYATMVNWESNVGSNFLGKYYIRWYENYSSSSSPEILSCQGDEAKFYKQGSSSLDFSSFMPSLDTETSPEFGFNSNRVKRAKNYDSLPIYKFNSKQGAVKDSFILVNRSILWSPPLASSRIIDHITELAAPHRPIQLGLASSFGDFINKHPSAKNKPFSDRDMLWVGFKMASGFNVSTSKVNHPTDEAFGRDCKVYVSAFSTPLDLGLKSKRCTRINIGPIGAIYMPPQSRVNDRTNGGYSVFVSNSRSVDYHQIVPKMEVVVSSFKNGNVLSNEINYNTSINLDNIQTTAFDKQKNNCLPNHAEIIGRMNTLVENTASLNSLPSKSVVYEIAGLPNSNFGPEHGLVGLSIRVNSKGASSTLSFSDLRNRTIPRSETLLEFEQIKNRVVTNSVTTHHINQNLISRNLLDNTIEL